MSQIRIHFLKLNEEHNLLYALYLDGHLAVALAMSDVQQFLYDLKQVFSFKASSVLCFNYVQNM